MRPYAIHERTIITDKTVTTQEKRLLGYGNCLK